MEGRILSCLQKAKYPMSNRELFDALQLKYEDLDQFGDCLDTLDANGKIMCQYDKENEYWILNVTIRKELPNLVERGDGFSVIISL